MVSKAEELTCSPGFGNCCECLPGPWREQVAPGTIVGIY
jgi:hypothetical protein